MHIHDGAFYVSILILTGIFTGTILKISGLFILIFVFISVFSVLLISFFAKEKKFWMFLAAFFIFFFFGFLYGQNFVLRSDGKYPEFNKIVNFSGRAKEGFNFKGKSLVFYIELEKPYKGKIKIYTDIFSEIEKGDKISFHGVVKVMEHGEIISYFPNMEIAEKNKKGILSEFREKIILGLKRFLPEKEAALASGLVLGDRRNFSEEFKDNLSKSGTTHIVALSGYNITIIVMAAGLVFGYFFRKEIVFLFSLIFIIIFTIMVGGEPSIVRAAIMGGIALFAVKFERLYSARNAIAISALLMAMFNPLSLKEPGFQLSFFSLIGIVYFLPAIKNFLPNYFSTSSFLNWKDNLLTTIAAQIAVLPLIFYYFGTFSIWSFLANILILEFVPYAMLFSFLIGFSFLFSGFGEFASWIFSFPAYFILKYQISVIDFFAEKSFLIKMDNFGIMSAVVFYILILFPVYIFYKKENGR
ncbi:MAG: ComEC/Rec2 family competence protein [Candidatus Pacebacteria bacterium]|nr:ComEC/Rec2 family competence protein [Candidatus Paceibacterota bacterium]